MDIQNIDSQSAIAKQTALELSQAKSLSKTEKLGAEPATVKPKDQENSSASVDISDRAKVLAERDADIKGFTKLLASEPQSSASAEKVSQLKNLLDSGRISEYLRTVNTDTLVNSLLKSSSAAFLTAK